LADQPRERFILQPNGTLAEHGRCPVFWAQNGKKRGGAGDFAPCNPQFCRLSKIKKKKIKNFSKKT
jgi:hypothetical protein